MPARVATYALVCALACGLLAGVLGCQSGKRYDQATTVLIDVSGTYADQKDEAVQIIKREILPAMIPGDSLAVIRIDSESYARENLEALLTLDRRPSHANAQKLALAQKLNRFAARSERSEHTDIPGAMMLASEYLKELGSGSRVILVFSDMQEELPPGTTRNLAEQELEETHVVAMNVKRLQRDSADPERYRARLAAWEQRVDAAGAAGWRTVVDARHLPEYLEQIRSGDPEIEQR